MRFYILDEREVWHRAVIEAATARGYQATRIFSGSQAEGPGLGFIRPHADPKRLKRNREDYDRLAQSLTMIQDRTQVQLYEDKSGQFREWHDWMPQTWRFTDRAAALSWAETVDLPIVSKADVGASSKNVRVIRDRGELRRHIDSLFGRGIRVNHCAGGAVSLQKGYLLAQAFIPHQVTWRVNAIGRTRAIFKRFCYRDRPVAQTGNVQPVMSLDKETESLLEYADRFFAHAGTKWCAIDVLRAADGWKLLETSLAWPWPSPGQCNKAPLFRSEHGRVWGDLWEAMFDEIEAGVW